MIHVLELKIGNKFLSAFGQVETVLSIVDHTDRGRLKVLSEEEYDSGKIGYASENHRDMYSHLILCQENGNQYKPCEITGVPINEKCLNKLEDEIIIWCQPEIAFVSICKKDYEIPTKNIKYLHQLQNLYFSLTGKELIFKKTADATNKRNKNK